MQKTDGHRLVETGRRQHLQFVECSRWEEITECVCYHIQLAGLLEAPSSFRVRMNSIYVECMQSCFLVLTFV